MRMRHAILLSAALQLAVFPGAAAAQETYVLWGDPVKGRQVYADKQCADCHAINGVGGTLGPDLGHAPARHYTVTQMAGIMWNHAPAMRRLAEQRGRAFPAFSETEMLDLLTYLYSLRFLDAAGDVPRGARLFRSKGCAACHAMTREQPGIGPALSAFRQYASPVLWAQIMWTHAATMEAKMRELGLRWPTLEGNEMVDLVTYIRSATSPPR